MVLQQVLIHGAGGGDLVAEAPDRDGGVVVALGDELPHGGEGVLPPVRHVHGDVGDLRPDHDAVLVAQVVEGLGVLVVCKTHGVGADLPDHGHVCNVVLIGEGVALALPVLVAAHAPEGIKAAVQQEALLRVEIEDAAAETGADLIPGRELSRRSVEIGVEYTVPQADVFDGEHGGVLHGLRLSVHGDVHSLGIMPGLHGDDGTTARFLPRSTTGVTLIPGVPSFTSSKCSRGTDTMFTSR